MLRIMDRVPLSVALIVGLGLGLSPFVPEPHVVEKLRMLGQGALTRPLDVFDLVWHASALALLGLKLIRIATSR